MHNYFIDFNIFNMDFNIKITNEDDFQKIYNFKLKYEFLTDEINIENKSYIDVIFGYTLDLDAGCFMNGEKVNINDLKQKDLKKVIKEMIIIKNDYEKDYLKSLFKDSYFLVEETLYDDFECALKIAQLELSRNN